MTISVIVPIYNAEKYIEKCAISLFEQTLKKNIEYIFVDDCSTDNSIPILQSIIAKYPDRLPSIKILHHNQNKGLAAVRNTGFAASSGQYIIHCDSDDWVNLKMYETLLETALTNNSDVVFCDITGVYKNKQIIHKQKPANTAAETVDMILSKKLHASLCNKLISRSLYNHLTALWEEGVNMGEDMSISPRLIYFAKTISYVEKPFYYYNQTNLSSYTKQNDNSSAIQLDKTYQIITNFFLEQKDCSHNDTLLKFGHITLYGIITHVPNGLEAQWIKKYINNHLLSTTDIPIYGIHRLIYQLYLYKHYRAANTLLKVINHIKRIVR